MRLLGNVLDGLLVKLSGFIRSSAVRNLAVSGKSWITQYDAIPIRTVTRPSRMKIHSQPCIVSLTIIVKGKLI